MDIVTFEKLIHGRPIKRKYRLDRINNCVKLKCSKCNSYRDYEDYSVDKGKSGLAVRSECKICQNKQNIKWYSGVGKEKYKLIMKRHTAKQTEKRRMEKQKKMEGLES